MSAFLSRTIVIQSLCDLKTSFLRFLEGFWYHFEISALKIFKNLNFQILLGHFKGGYLPQVGGFHEKSPEIAFSDRVDAV